jgi:plasmid stabilization system protein ParE
MSRVIFTRHAQADLRRLYEFLRKRSPGAAGRAKSAIVEAIGLLQAQPEAGRPIDDDFRELVIRFGKSGYLALYRYDGQTGMVGVTAIRHQQEGWHSAGE